MSDTIPRILFTSLSSKDALYREVSLCARLFSHQSSVVASDCNPNCDAACKVNQFIELPRIDQITDSVLLRILKENRITHILPTSDFELPFWSQKKSFLKTHQITAWVSDLPYIKYCEDKLLFCEKWKNAKLPIVPTFEYPEISSVDRWVAKERHGSGSRNISLNLNRLEAIDVLNKSSRQMIFQPFINGKEFTAEIWISRSRHCYGPLLRWRNKIIQGEAHETTIFRNFRWESMLRSVFLHYPGAFGHCIAQVMVDESGKLNLIEINPRMGGASPLALKGGLSSVAWHLMEDNGQIDEVPFTPIIQNGISLTKNNGIVSYQMH